ncbi:MAG: succinylglutamate desuccinylase/aspartoacylase family protein [Alphaproteobacteria bacterium]|nr:succinylglutamate desuccinylase/aspartoacylase family protein [Alphaproteobacteria bacterium]
MPNDFYAVDLLPPDISGYRDGNTGIPYVTSFASGKPGPHVVVNAVTHGNELCGAIALDFLFRNKVRPVRGTLTLSFANVAAFLAFDPKKPNGSRFIEEDFNRVWDVATLDGPRQSAELTRARALRPAIDRADFLLDLHSMQHATAPLMLTGLLDKSLELACRVGIPELIVRDEGHAAGRRMRDYGGFGDPASPKTALLVECGQHWEKQAEEVAIATTLRFLAALEIIEPALLSRHRGAASTRQRVITVTDAITIATDHFEFAEDFRGLEVLQKKGTPIGRDGEREIRTPYDECVLIMPSRRLKRGQTAVRLGRFTG